MSTELSTTKKSNDLINFSEEEIGLIKTQICKPKDREATDTELKYFMAVSKQAGLNPFFKQIYAVFRKVKDHKTNTYNEVMSIQTSIDGFRLTADRTRAYAGSDQPQFEYMDTDTRQAQPIRAYVTVYKIVGGVRCPFTAEASWDEFYPGDNANGTMWRKMPRIMLAKCAEAQALRKAFPAELGQLYTSEEMQRTQDSDELANSLSDHYQGMDYKRRDEQIEEVKTELKSLTDGLSLQEKGKFLVEKCGVRSFEEFKEFNNEQLDKVLGGLKSLTIEVAG